ncbi:hypothetical protein JVU11DRAFT_10776 [Chiua virens]|nr:hypothetical protein JVU11DRAFT_10776 [Chiua virens]
MAMENDDHGLLYEGYDSETSAPTSQQPLREAPKCTIVKEGPFTFIYETGPPSTTGTTKRSCPDSDVESLDDMDNVTLVADDRDGGPAKSKSLKKPVARKSKRTRTKAMMDTEVGDRDLSPSLSVTKDQQDTVAELAPTEITGHLWLKTVTTTSIPGRSRSAKPNIVTTVDAMQCPAFIFTTNTPFNGFLDEMAKTAQVSISQIDEMISKLLWKHETPAKGERKLLSDETSYKAMVKSAQAKKGNAVIFFYLPKPLAMTVTMPAMSSVATRNASSMMVLTDNDKSTNYDIDSIKGQILEERYPVSNHPLFPDKRIYARGKEFWELTTFRLDVWATAIALGRATYDAPPTSTHFSAKTAIKPTRPPPSAPLKAFSAYHHYKQDAPGPGGLANSESASEHPSKVETTAPPATGVMPQPTYGLYYAPYSSPVYPQLPYSYYTPPLATHAQVNPTQASHADSADDG